jgi:FkbM family methyltransferase
MQVDPSDYLQLLLYYTGTFEETSLRVMRKCLPAGGVMMDVGANIGLYTLEAAIHAGASGRVIAVEAAPCHVDAARANVALNGLRNVTVVHAAAGAAPGHARLAMPSRGNRGEFTLGHSDADLTIDVTVRTLSDIAAEAGIERLDVMKMDIEGSEDAALRGAGALLERFRPTLLVELNDAALTGCDASSGMVKQRLHDAGYVGARIAARRLEPLAIGTTHVCDECVFVHRDRNDLLMRLQPGHKA